MHGQVKTIGWFPRRLTLAERHRTVRWGLRCFDLQHMQAVSTRVLLETRGVGRAVAHLSTYTVAIGDTAVAEVLWAIEEDGTVRVHTSTYSVPARVPYQHVSV
jgi:hypothetical protein